MISNPKRNNFIVDMTLWVRFLVHSLQLDGKVVLMGITLTAHHDVHIPSCFSFCQACGCVCWSPSSSKDSACVAAGYSDGTLRIFRLASSEMEMKLHPHHVAVTAIQYSANGERGQQFQKLIVFTVYLGVFLHHKPLFLLLTRFIC